MDGGKQADLLRGVKPIVSKKISEWAAAGVIALVANRLACIDPLLLVPNVK